MAQSVDHARVLSQGHGSKLHIGHRAYFKNKQKRPNSYEDQIQVDHFSMSPCP